MVNWVGFLLKAGNFYCQLIGLNNFKFDLRTGRVYKSWKCTLYAISINSVFFAVLVYCSFGPLDSKTINGNAKPLHVSVAEIISFLRIVAGTCTILNRWLQRNQLMQIVRRFSLLMLSNPPTNRKFCWIFFKIFTSIGVDLIYIVLNVVSMDFTITGLPIRLVLQFWTLSIMNMAILQYNMVLIFIWMQYHDINKKLRRLIQECQRLSYLSQKKGTVMTRCCFISDQLDDIAKLQSRLQSIVTQLGEVFGVQAVMAYSGYYMTSVITNFLIYCVFKYGPEKLNLTYCFLEVLCIWSCFYYLDGFLNLKICFSIIAMHKKMMRLLEERTLFASMLDVRLEETFDSLQLQLVRNPLKIEIMGMFQVDHASIAAMCNSVILNSIVLIQYDLQID